MVTKKDLEGMTQEEKFKLIHKLEYTKGYATALQDIVKMVVHLKGRNPEAKLSVDELVDVINIALESQPLYQDFKKEHPEKFKE